eukprot:TRINITY_DN28445_c0_g1_i1.p3 TRINITY_DN28445_c0_g1~~TRINITY_DN28445_c0_g1_i1.p3  ORF type:complete len:110 (+),score=24.09 TRINITY_DN28445_c0_g1_i1:462-791(+)
MARLYAATRSPAQASLVCMASVYAHHCSASSSSSAGAARGAAAPRSGSAAAVAARHFNAHIAEAAACGGGGGACTAEARTDLGDMARNAAAACVQACSRAPAAPLLRRQ